MTRAAKLRLAARVAPDRNHVTATNRAFDNPIVAQIWNPLTEAGRAALNAVVNQQAQIIARTSTITSCS